MADSLLLPILLVPALTSALVLLAGRGDLAAPGGHHAVPGGRRAGWIATFGLALTGCLVALAGPAILDGRTLAATYLPVAPGIRVGLLADGLSYPTLAIVVLLCAALCCYSIRYIEHRVAVLYGDAPAAVQATHYRRFFALLPFFPFGFIGTILSTNLVTLYFFMEALTITLFFLMAFYGYRERVRIAFVSLAWGILGALLFLAGALIVYSRTGSLEIAELARMADDPLAPVAIALLLAGLAMKLAIVPFHVWMPSVHAEHPTCIAGLLAVYANLALYVVVRVLVLPLGGEMAPFGLPLMGLALVTMVYGSLLTLAQTDIKRLAACSTISQIAYSVLGLGALNAAGIEGGMFFFLSHVMGKTIFFSTAGIVVYTTGIRDMRELGGLAARMPVTAGLWIAGALMLSGFPPFSSFAAEWILFTGVFERAVASGPATVAIGVCGVAAILLTVAYTFGAARQIFFGPLSPALAERDDLRDPAWTMTAPLIAVAVASVVLGLWPSLVLDLLDGVVGP